MKSAICLFALGLLAATTPSMSKEQALSADVINKAELRGKGAKPSKPAMIKAEVLLDRTRFSPGVIDGSDGENVQHAINAFQKQNGLQPSGKLNPDTWKRLIETGQEPVMTEYTITEDDVKGPFTERIPPKMEEQADLDRLAYTGPLELLSEKFHMSEALLKALNKDKSFDRPGTVITVANVASAVERRKAKASKIEVNSRPSRCAPCRRAAP